MLARLKGVSLVRLILGISLIIGLVLLWQAYRLDRWGAFGPGPGLFPQVLAFGVIFFTAMMLLIPRLTDDKNLITHEDDDGPMAPPERRAYTSYLLALGAMIITTTWSGFIITCLAITMITTWWGEREAWWKALAFGLISGLIGVIGFAYYMQVELPQDALELYILHFFR